MLFIYKVIKYFCYKFIISKHTNNKEVIMTQKELLYVEDAIGHECNIISIIIQYIG